MNKPRFEEGQTVTFDFGNGTSGRGKIRGLAFEHLIDGWIVEVEASTGIDKATYPWSCIVVTHPQLKAAQPEEEQGINPSWTSRPDLYECQECTAQSGSPNLCQRCLEARSKAGPAWVGPRYRSCTAKEAMSPAVICTEADCGATMQAKPDGGYSCPQCQAQRSP